MTFAMWTKDYSGHGGDLGAIEQQLRCLTTVAADRGNIRKSVESARWRRAPQPKFIEAR